MPFKLSFPDLARRLARGLGIIGKTPVSLDETAVQTVLIRDLTLPEFARIPIEWSTHGVVGAIAANFSVVGIRCNDGVLVITQTRALSTTGGIVQMRLNRVALGTPSGFFSSAQLHVLNRPGDEQLVTSGHQVGAASPGAVPGVIIDESALALGRAVDLDIVLFPGDEVYTTTTANNNALEAFYAGKQYPDLR